MGKGRRGNLWVIVAEQTSFYVHPCLVSSNLRAGLFATTHTETSGLAQAERCLVPPTEGVPSLSLQPPTKAYRLPRSLPSAPPPAVSRDVVVEPELPGLSRAKFVAGCRCGCNHKG